jgi:cold shock CspA family protein
MSERCKGQIKYVNLIKRYGFIRCESRNGRDIFFHFSDVTNLPSPESRLQDGGTLEFDQYDVPDKGYKAVNITITHLNDQSPDASYYDTYALREQSLGISRE